MAILQQSPDLGNGFGGFGIAAVTLIARPDGFLVHLEVLLADESVGVLRGAQARNAESREHAGVDQVTKSHRAAPQGVASVYLEALTQFPRRLQDYRNEFRSTPWQQGLANPTWRL